MSKDGKLLNIIDEQGNIVGTDTRENIHKNGLLHREIHVWFYTPKDEVIFQHRAKNKDTFPDMFDATVGGHVEINSDFEDTAIKEIEEETGIVAEKSNLKYIYTVRSNYTDSSTGMKNNVVRKIFAYKFVGQISDLRIEKGKSEGFEMWSVSALNKLNNEEKKRFIPSLLNQEHLDMYTNFLTK